MSPDLSNLKLVEENIEVADDAQYVDASEFPPPPPEGLYTLIQGKPTFEATKDGLMGAAMDHVISGGEHDGQKIMFDRVSEKTFERSGTKASSMRDHLRAVYTPNESGRTARSRAEMGAALEAAEGRPFKAKLQWEGYCKHAETPQEGQPPYSIQGEAKFPANGTGRQSEIPCPTCQKTIYARARIKFGGRVVAQ
jgi:hypothetical protein